MRGTSGAGTLCLDGAVRGPATSSIPFKGTLHVYVIIINRVTHIKKEFVQLSYASSKQSFRKCIDRSSQGLKR